MLNEMDALITFAVAGVDLERKRPPKWTPEHDEFIRQNLGWMTDEEMGKALGRTAVAVHLHWDRDMGLPGPSKAPNVITARRAADMLGIDGHKTAGWVDMGLIPGRLMPGRQTKCHTIRLIDRTVFRRWVLNPVNWVYFRIDKVRDSELKRMLWKRAKRWGDQWWTVRQVANWHDVPIKNVEQQIRRGQLPSFHLPITLSGRHWHRAWSYHYVLRSDALRAKFVTGKGGNRKISKFTPAADAWILKAHDELRMTFVAIGRTMKIGKWSYHHRTNPIIAYRYRQLKTVAASKKHSKRRT